MTVAREKATAEAATCWAIQPASESTKGSPAKKSCGVLQGVFGMRQPGVKHKAALLLAYLNLGEDGRDAP
jgi:hypothetical protein